MKQRDATVLKPGEAEPPLFQRRALRDATLFYSATLLCPLCYLLGHSAPVNEHMTPCEVCLKQAQTPRLCS